MKIAIDARMMTYTGIGRYVENLVLALSRLYQEDAYSVLIRSAGEACGQGANLEFKVPRRRIPVYSIREQILTPLELRGLKADLVHYPSFNMPVLSPAPAVVTIHDLIYYLDRDACPNAAAYWYARFMFRAVAAMARRIITVSRFSKAMIVEHLGVPPEKIAVIYHGVSPIYRPREDATVDEARRKYGLDRDYLLYVGNHSPRKNLLCLATAFMRISGRFDCLLALAGKKDARRGELYREISELDGEGRVRFIGEVPEDDLPALYSGALLFVFPSLYEGFGFPVIEAMACGAPVVTSNVTSLPEVVGKAGIMVDPRDTDALASEMLRVLESRDLRAELGEKGLERARLFNWDETARMTHRVYEEALLS